MKNIELTKRDRLRLLVTGVLLGFAVITVLPKHTNVKCDEVNTIYIESDTPYDEAAHEADMARAIAEANGSQNTASDTTQSVQPTSTTSTIQTTKTEQKKPAYTEAEIAAAWSETSRTEATCAVDGKVTYKNSLTGKTKTETIPATGKHSYKKTNVVDATCIEDGTVTYTCTVCEDSYIETIPATGHKAGKDEIAKKAGFFHQGTQITKCSICGEILSTKAIPQICPISLNVVILIVCISAVIIIGTIVCIRKKAVIKKEVNA